MTCDLQALPLFGAERTVFWRESRHFSSLAYALGKWLAALPLTAIYPLVVLLFWYQLVQPAATISGPATPSNTASGICLRTAAIMPAPSRSPEDSPATSPTRNGTGTNE